MKLFGIDFRSSARAGSGMKAGILVLSALFALGAQAQDKKAAPSSPVGGTWDSTTVNTADRAGAEQGLTPEQSNAINIVNTYFNELVNLQGRFVQVDPDQKKTKGKFFVQKPGKFHFSYSSPSRKIIISDGNLLAIQDLDLRNEDVYELDNTPFRILLRNNVNILNDARILAVDSNEAQVSVTLADKDPDAVGRITVVMSVKPEPILLGWITSDGQGQNTKVTVSQVSKPEKLDGALFKRKQLFKDATQIGSK